MKNIVKVKTEFDIVIRPTNYAQYKKMKAFQIGASADSLVLESYMREAEMKVRKAIFLCIDDFENDVLTEVGNCNVETRLIMEGDEP